MKGIYLLISNKKLGKSILYFDSVMECAEQPAIL